MLHRVSDPLFRPFTGEPFHVCREDAAEACVNKVGEL